MIKDYVTPVQRLVPFDTRDMKGIEMWLLKQAMKRDPILAIKKNYRYWRKRMAASLVNPSPQTQVRLAVA